MKKKLFILFFIVCLPWILYAQNRNNFQKQQKDPDPNAGVDFYIGAGCFFASKKTANYYNGESYNENSLGYIFNNESWRKEIENRIMEKHHDISFSDNQYTIVCPQNMKYKPAVSVTLGARYRFDSHWRIGISYTYARTVAQDVFQLKFKNSVSGNERNNYLMYDLVGTENRSMIDITFSYTFQAHEMVKPFVELGGQFNFLRVKSFKAIIEDKDFSLLDEYGGVTYVQGADQQKFKTHYGGAGFALVGTVGISIDFKGKASLDPCFYANFGKLHLPNYQNFAFHCGAYIRLVMTDKLFKKQE